MELLGDVGGEGFAVEYTGVVDVGIEQHDLHLPAYVEAVVGGGDGVGAPGVDVGVLAGGWVDDLELSDAEFLLLPGLQGDADARHGCDLLLAGSEVADEAFDHLVDLLAGELERADVVLVGEQPGDGATGERSGRKALADAAGVKPDEVGLGHVAHGVGHEVASVDGVRIVVGRTPEAVATHIDEAFAKFSLGLRHVLLLDDFDLTSGARVAEDEIFRVDHLDIEQAAGVDDELADVLEVTARLCQEHQVAFGVR